MLLASFFGPKKQLSKQQDRIGLVCSEPVIYSFLGRQVRRGFLKKMGRLRSGLTKQEEVTGKNYPLPSTTQQMKRGGLQQTHRAKPGESG